VGPIAGPELIVGLVGTVDLDMDMVATHVARALREVAYASYTIRLSDLLRQVDLGLELEPEDTQGDRAGFIETHQDAGDLLRTKTQRGDLLALLAIARIRELRRHFGSDQAEAEQPATVKSPNQIPLDREVLDLYQGLRPPLSRTAFILRSLKHPDEARTLRDVYGPRFVLIGAHDGTGDSGDFAAEIAHSRSHALRKKDKDDARRIMERDNEDVETPFGQNVLATFPLSDFFLDVGSEKRLKAEASRFVELLFSSPYRTPKQDEVGMSVAHAASLRSAALGRQVGAAVLDESGAVVSVGTNEVPKSHGGQYWTDDEYDKRDFCFQDGSDSSDTMRRAILSEMLDRYKKFNIETPRREDSKDELTIEELLPVLKSTRIGNLVEFGRTVHAEMAALVDAARRGVSVKDTILYTTTFPCHTCARHIVGAGVSEVVFLEQYSKSMALDLHQDSIFVGVAGTKHQIGFRQYSGIAPRRYSQLFTMVDRKDDLGYRISFRPESALPRGVDLQPFYQYREWRAVADASEALRDSKIGVSEDLLDQTEF
jgi:deoxycytidylate deaminase